MHVTTLCIEYWLELNVLCQLSCLVLPFLTIVSCWWTC